MRLATNIALSLLVFCSIAASAQAQPVTNRITEIDKLNYSNGDAADPKWAPIPNSAHAQFCALSRVKIRSVNGLCRVRFQNKKWEYQLGSADDLQECGVICWNATSAVFSGLGFLPGQNSSQAFGLSGDGKTVVGASGNQAFRWTEADGMQPLGFLSGGSYSRAMGVSTDGLIVVGTADSSKYPLGETFRWTKESGRMEPLGVLDRATMSYAYGVSGDGSVVVGMSDTPGTVWQAFKWSLADKVMKPLGFLPGGGVSGAFDVNSNGSMIVGTSTKMSGAQAARWSSNIITPVPVAAPISQAFGVAEDGSIVVGWGGASTMPPAQGNFAFRWTESDNKTVNLGTLMGADYSVANGLSADGSVVVGTSGGGEHPHGQAFHWTTSTPMKSIKEILLALGVDIQDWDLQSATKVRVKGQQHIIGFGQDPSGRIQAWIAHIEP
jgi:probable HAF family extracellular repeat protein